MEVVSLVSSEHCAGFSMIYGSTVYDLHSATTSVIVSRAQMMRRTSEQGSQCDDSADKIASRGNEVARTSRVEVVSVLAKSISFLRLMFKNVGTNRFM